jgi:hypothetical protein
VTHEDSNPGDELMEVPGVSPQEAEALWQAVAAAVARPPKRRKARPPRRSWLALECHEGEEGGR